MREAAGALVPYRSAAWPQSDAVGRRATVSADESRLATKPAASASSAQPRSTAMMPTYEKKIVYIGSRGEKGPGMG